MIWLWPIIFCVLVLSWGIYWSFLNQSQRDIVDIRERVMRLETILEERNNK